MSGLSYSALYALREVLYATIPGLHRVIGMVSKLPVCSSEPVISPIPGSWKGEVHKVLEL